jgi:hypothetical protein
MKILSTGRYPSEETKRKMSENNAMNYENFRKKVSDGVKKSYENNHELKNLRRDSMIGREISEHTKEKNYASGRWLRPEEKNEFSVYCEKVKQITEENFTKYFYQIPNGKKRSREYHLDHKFSTSAGYRLGLSEEVIGHYKNLEIVFHSINESKGAKCSITLHKLFTEIQQSEYPIETHKLFCGGAYGHISHPFEDFGLTMQDLRDMINTTVNGSFGPENFVQEKCVSGDTIVELEKRGHTTIKELVENRYEDSVLSQKSNGDLEFMPVLDWCNNGPTKEWLEIETEDDKVIRVTPNHRIFANGVDIKAEELQIGDVLATANYTKGK